MRARIYRSAPRQFLCKILDSSEMVKAHAPASLLDENSVVPGDLVELERDKDDYKIKRVEERENQIFRMAVRQGKKKVIAANCDLLVIIVSVFKPIYKRGIVDRFLIRAHQWDIEALVIFNKMDEYDGKPNIVFEKDRLQDLGVQCFEISAKYTDYKNQYLSDGFPEFKQKLAEKAAIFLGQSGVGKSKSINALTDGTADLKTSKPGKAGKGVHTTTWSEIIDFGNFRFIDSPGIRSFSLDDLQEEEVIDYFPDIAKLGAQCRFSNCNHDSNARGCFFSTLPADDYRTKLLLSRLESFKKIKKEVGVTPFWEKK